MNYDHAIHSDFLVHWTGSDIDKEVDPNWAEASEAGHSRTSPEADARYISRLRNILKFGLWMTEENEDEYLGIKIPVSPKCCFTELKLSESRKHAMEYGRLGIGLKRPFLFERGGRPLTYFGYHRDVSRDRLFQACASDLTDKRLLNFFKPMNSSRALNYDFYGESEWRLLFFSDLLASGKIVDPRDGKNVEANAYLKSLQPTEQEKLKYLLPVDAWLGLLIYPSLSLKNLAQQDRSNGIFDEIRRIKSDRFDHANRVENGNLPIELNLDACRNF